MLVVYRSSYRTKTELSASLSMSFFVIICGLFLSDVIRTVFASPEPKKLTNEEVLKELGVEIKMKGKTILTYFPITYFEAFHQFYVFTYSILFENLNYILILLVAFSNFQRSKYFYIFYYPYKNEKIQNVQTKYKIERPKLHLSKTTIYVYK